MTTKVWLSTLGRAVDPEDATISVFDRGFLYGDSVYETMRTAGGRPVELHQHLLRLEGSADGIGLDLPFSHAQIADAIAKTHAASGNDESYVRVMVTRGAGPIALDPRKSAAPTLVVVVQPLVLPAAEQYEHGVTAWVVDVVKSGGSGLDPRIKSGNYLANILALRQAIARGADDAIMRSEGGDISEGATSNLFLVDGAGALVTPHLAAGVLEGITRRAVCRLAEDLEHPVQERRVPRALLDEAREVFLTSSVRGIMPVTRIDGQEVGDGRIGPFTRKIKDAYDAWLVREAASHASS